MNNPWNDLNKGCMRRIEAEYDLFWAKDEEAHNLFIIEFKSDVEVDISSINIAGMKIFLNQEDNIYRIILMLNDVDDTEIFYKLCTDILSLIKSFEDKISVTAIIGRLKRWQNFLSRGKKHTLSMEKQIGLYGELSFLYNKLISQVGCDKAIKAWVGPDKDKQDFRLNSINIEIKTYLDNKRGIVHVSSIEQLNPINGKLFLYAYGIKIDEKGISIADYVKTIKETIVKSDSKLMFKFEELVEKYGFYDCCEYDNLFKFSIFEENIYNVTNEFPKINLDVKKSEITAIEYSIDLSMCDDFKTSSSDLEKFLM